MNNEVCRVAVDVGNSLVKLAVRRDPLMLDHAIRIHSANWERSAVDWVYKQTGCQHSDWRIASVHGSAATQLKVAIEERHRVATGAGDSRTTIQFVTRHDVPLPLDVDHPDRVGIDRLLSAYAATIRIRPPAVVIDAGSAVTVDWVNQEGRFCGGAILPGLGLQSRSLATGTDALPHIQWDSQNAIRLPAKNTVDAIRGGILAGIAGSIDALIQRYGDVAGVQSHEIQVVLTGGDGPAISPHLRHIHELMPNLVCCALLDLPRSMVGQTNSHAKSE